MLLQRKCKKLMKRMILLYLKKKHLQMDLIQGRGMGVILVQIIIKVMKNLIVNPQVILALIMHI